TDAEILCCKNMPWPSHKKKCWKSVADMSKSIWAKYFHKLSTDENPQHALCPMGEESWWNPNESFNNCVWNRVPKNICKQKNFANGVMDAVICFNEGAYARTEVLKALKINPGVNTCEGFVKLTTSEICEAEMAVQSFQRSQDNKRQIKRKQDALGTVNEDEYSAGNF
ncbi:uncharacterized protein TNCV_2818901, partial [Trichonephila clavipes]